MVAGDLSQIRLQLDANRVATPAVDNATQPICIVAFTESRFSSLVAFACVTSADGYIIEMKVSSFTPQGINSDR